MYLHSMQRRIFSIQEKNEIESLLIGDFYFLGTAMLKSLVLEFHFHSLSYHSLAQIEKQSICFVFFSYACHVQILMLSIQNIQLIFPISFMQSYSVVNYNEKVMDGFYDVCGLTSNSVVQGNMPLLVDLQAISISENVDYEVIMVNRYVDAELQDLEKKAYIMSLESTVSDGLIQKIADVVVDRMGGPVSDAGEMSSRWKRRSKELQNTLNSIILPLGCLDVGLSRHRALLFKVLRSFNFC